jgi:glucokinase
VRVLGGDVGGTKTLLMVAKCSATGCEPLVERGYPSGAYPSLEPIVAEFLQEALPAAGPVERACFAVAGPVHETGSGQHARITNLPWVLDSARLGARLGIPHVRLINDFQGVGYGIDALGPDDLVVLQTGHERTHAPRALIGAGTGLGEGFLVWHADHYEVYPSEGGHVDFAPGDALQIELLRSLLGELGRVSCERVLSGPGLVRIYAFLRERGEARESPDLHQAMAEGDPAAAISRHALEHRDPLASLALELFVRIYGAQAGNLALTTLARGGVYLAGGIAPKIIDRLLTGDFLQAFNAKGRMAPLTAEMPVRVIRNPRVGLLGAALAASRL